MNRVKAQKYMQIAKAVAQLSKSRNTQVGALILGADSEVRSLGYNGAPRGSCADEDERYIKPEKYYWFCHAELNAITNAAKVGTPIDGCTLIVTHPPCMDCARAIVQSGIKEVISVKPDAKFSATWGDHLHRTEKLFHEVGVEYTWLD